MCSACSMIDTTIKCWCCYIFRPTKQKKKKQEKNTKFKQQHEKSIWELFVQLNDNECGVCFHGVPPFLLKKTVSRKACRILYECSRIVVIAHMRTANYIICIGVILCSCMWVCVFRFKQTKHMLINHIWQLCITVFVCLCVWVHPFLWIFVYCCTLAMISTGTKTKNFKLTIPVV